MPSQTSKRKDPLSRMTDQEYANLIRKHPRKGMSPTKDLGRMEQNDYEKSFNKTYFGCGFNRNKVTSDDVE